MGLETTDSLSSLLSLRKLAAINSIATRKLYQELHELRRIPQDSGETTVPEDTQLAALLDLKQNPDKQGPNSLY